MKLITFNGSKDYNKLNSLPFNRNFKVRNDLVDKMNKVGFTVPLNLIETDLITGRKQIFIADGQHRAVTAAFLDISFHGVIVNIDFKSIEQIVEYVAMLNSSQKAWVTRNYAESFAYLGKKEYITLISITEKSPYSLDTMSSLLTGVRSNGTAKQKVMNGTFKCTQITETVKTLELASRLSKIYKISSKMILALHYISSLKTFNEDKFTKEYKKNIQFFKDHSLNDYTDVFSSWI